MITIPTEQVLEALGYGANWIQGDWSTDDGKLCLHGGIRQCQVVPGDAYLIEQVGAKYDWGTEFNDGDGRVWPDIETALRAHREVLPDELEATFGPQWEHIVALVRRAAVLTVDEGEQLAAESGASRFAASDAARYAAWDASRYAEWGASSGAAWEASRHAARAAVALSMRDLIGQHGFSQEHYDILTGPWATVIGPVHPDDERTPS